MLASEPPKIDVVVDVKPLLGEGPVWDVDAQRLYFVDALGRRIFRCTEDGAELRAWTVPSRIGALALRARGGAVVALADGFHGFDFESGEAELIVDPEPGLVGNALNDGKIDPGGTGRVDLGWRKGATTAGVYSNAAAIGGSWLAGGGGLIGGGGGGG